MSDSPHFAFVTLVTTDHYLPGALVVAAALRDIHPSPPTSTDELDPSEFHTVCLVTPESVDVSTVKLLRRAFDVVIGVELIEEETEEGLRLLGRLDLKTVLTKLHIFRLTTYQKIIFLDADILPLRPLSHLFRIAADFAAVPDVGWPDIFNSGFLVLSPSEERFDDIMSLVKSKGSWDGGDQGVLNEWKGSEWERLSFTYNTTPTAAYTYAPAYKRFGSQISNIHFIGPNKPWDQIPFRAPGSSSSDSAPVVRPSQTFTPPPSYAYPALLDRWFAVYDKHYRNPDNGFMFKGDVVSADADSTRDFGTQRYENVWNSNAHPEPGVEVSASGAPLGLEELRRLAVEGLGVSATSADEGVYHSLPLEGRIDLIRPQKLTPDVPENYVSTDTEKPMPPVVHIQVPDALRTPTRLRSPAPMTTLPTPGPTEFPPTPVFRGHSLPPDSPTHHRAHIRPVSPLRATSPPHPTLENPPRPPPSPPHIIRPTSPPLLSWNPAVEDPPTAPPPVSHFPEQTYFPNVWDAQEQDHHVPEDGGGFFPLPPPPSIPEQLIREGHYNAVIGQSHQEDQQHHHAPAYYEQQQDSHHEQHRDQGPPPPSHPQPDRSKITTVFPWEAKPRYAPERYFPPTDSPPPGEPFIKPQSPALKVELHPPRSSPLVSPVHVFPRTTTYANAWDTVPSIQRYASRLVRPPPAPAPLVPAGWTAPPAGVGRTRKGSAATAGGGDEYRSWQDRVEVSSRDADDEDEGDDDEERSPPSIGAQSDQGDGVGELPPKKTYHVKGVQTVPKEVKHQGVQVQNGKRSARSGSRHVPSQHDSGTGGKEDPEKPSPPKSGRGLPQEMKVFEQTAAGSPAVNAPGFMLPLQAGQSENAQPQTSEGDKLPPSGALSPRLHDEYAFGHVARQNQTTLQNQAPELSPPVPQEPSASSSTSSLGPYSPPEGFPVSQSSQDLRSALVRPAGRTFDPARGVDVFKKGSEEVLARFLKMGSWEEEPPQSPSIV